MPCAFLGSGVGIGGMVLKMLKAVQFGSVKEWMRRNPVVIARNKTVKDAANIMVAHGIGSLIVVEDEKPDLPVGIFTEKDVLSHIVKTDINPANVEVGTFMSRNIVSVEEDEEILRVARKMIRYDVRVVPVLDGEGKLSGIVTLQGVIRKLAEMSCGYRTGLCESLKKIFGPYFGELSGFLILGVFSRLGKELDEGNAADVAGKITDALLWGETEAHKRAIMEKVVDAIRLHTKAELIGSEQDD